MKFVKKTVFCVATSLCWIIPVAISLSKTSAGKTLQGAEGIFCGNPFYLFHRMSYTAIPVTTTQNQGDANLFCGSIVIVLLILFLLNKKINKREKKARFLLLGIYASGLWISPLNLLFHGFHKPIGIPNRFSFIIIFLMLQISVRSMEKISGSAKKEIFVATGFGLAVIITDMLFVKSWISLLSLLIVAYFGIICCKARSGSWKKIWKVILAVVLILDIFSHASYGISMKRLTGRNILISRSEAIEKLLERKHDLEAYRTVLASPKVRNEEMLNNLNGMSLFCSTVPADVLLTMKKLGIFVRTNTVQYKGNSELIDIIFGVKYIIAEPKAMMYRTAYREDTAYNNLHLFVNRNALKSGNRLEQQIMKRKWRGRNVFDIHEKILAFAGCRSLYDQKLVKADEVTASDEWKSCYRIRVKKGRHYYLYIPGKLAKKVRVNNTVYDYKNQNTSFLDLGYITEDGTVTVRTDQNEQREAVLGSYPEKRLEQIAGDLRKRFDIV